MKVLEGLGKAGQDARTCAGPGCNEPLEGKQARYCSEKCRKAVYRARVQAERQPSEHQKSATTSRRRNRPDPLQVEAAAEEYARALAAEAERSLRRDPSRWSWRRTTEVPDDRHRIGQRQGAKP